MTPNDYIIAALRTLTAYLVGALVTWAAVELGVDDLDEAGLRSAAQTVVAAAYYLALRALETRYPWVGVFLGWKPKKTPAYSDTDVTVIPAGQPPSPEADHLERTLAMAIVNDPTYPGV